MLFACRSCYTDFGGTIQWIAGTRFNPYDDDMIFITTAVI